MSNDTANSKLISSKVVAPMTGKGSGAGTGPTASRSSYPKGSAPKLDASKFNPMHTGKSTYGLGGV